MSIEAMKQALEALELALRCHGVMLLSDPPKDAWKYHGVEADANKAITALRTAIAETEKQEPVLEVVNGQINRSWDAIPSGFTGLLYTTPPAAQRKEWQGLTDDEIKEIIGSWGDTPIKGYTRKLFDQIEAKLKEKNT